MSKRLNYFNYNFRDFPIYRNKNLEEHIASIDADLKSTTTDLFATKEQLSYYMAENKELHGEMAVINQVGKVLFINHRYESNCDYTFSILSF